MTSFHAGSFSLCFAASRTGTVTRLTTRPFRLAAALSVLSFATERAITTTTTCVVCFVCSHVCCVGIPARLPPRVCALPSAPLSRSCAASNGTSGIRQSGRFGCWKRSVCFVVSCCCVAVLLCCVVLLLHSLLLHRHGQRPVPLPPKEHSRRRGLLVLLFQACIAVVFAASCDREPRQGPASQSARGPPHARLVWLCACLFPSHKCALTQAIRPEQSACLHRGAVPN